ncbi:hypothetical protein P8605_24465 [Streptomyces sp. T-3]|nr:hypothetical protein [Streptomyces sp. T-3]
MKAAPRGRGGGGAGGGGGGVGGGSGRAGAKPKKSAPAPNVSNATPEAGLSAAASLKPHLALTTLKGVNGAVGRSVSKERGDLKDSPPTMERPVGSPRSLRGGPKPSAPGSYTSQRVGKTDAAQGSTPEIKGEKTPSGDLPGSDMKEPGWWDIGKALLMGLGKKLLSKLLPIDKLTGSIDDMPTTDKGLQGAKVGDAPKLPLKDDSDPQRTDKQAKLLDDKGAEVHASGRDDAARPMGEDQIFPDVPKETLTAKVGGGKKQGGDGGGPAGTPGAGLPVEAVSAVAEHEQGPQIKQAFGQARQKMTAARREKETKAGRDRRQYQRDVRREVDTNTKEQASARNKGRSEIVRSRAGWRKEQDDKLSDIDGKKGKQFTKARKDIKDKQDKTDKDVDQRTKDDQKKIDDQRTGAEKEVVKKRDDGKKDSRNWFEKGLDWIKEQFNKLKQAIKDVFEKARNLVKGFIEEFKKQVFKFIDEARKWVIDKINDFADALIRLGDELLKDYPAMRDKWRKSINGLRDAAVKKVNEFADKLKKIAGRLIDAFGDMLLAGLDILEKGLLTAVSIAEAVTVKAMELGAALLKGLGEWAAIATDILSDPGGWIGKAKDAAVTGAKQHLFTEIKAAVKEWFNQKIQQLIGIPMEMFNRLVKGGTSKEEMAKMAWDAALPQLPLIIGELIVTKVVAKLIPGAGWVMAIIDALKTAYDALGAILRAFGMFMTFLKSVKSGNGALPFAKAVASGVVALLELIYQWLVSGVGKYLGKVGKALRGRAAKLGKKDSSPDPKKDPGKDPKKDPKDEPDKGLRKDPAKDPRKDAPRQEDPAPRRPEQRPTKDPDRDGDKDKRDDDRDPVLRPRPTKRTDSKGPDGRGPDSRRPGDRRPDGKRPVDKKPDDKRPDLTKSKDKRPDSHGPAKDGKRPNKDAPGQKRKPADKQKSKKPSVLSRVRDAVKNALAKVRRALRRLGNRARSLLNKLKNFARRLKELWRRLKDRMRKRREREKDRRDRSNGDTMRDLDRPKVRFRDEDDHDLHTLIFRGKGRGAQLYVHSTPSGVPPFIKSWKADVAKLKASPEKTAQLAAIRQAEKYYEQADTLQERLPRRVNRKRSRAQWETDYRLLRNALANLGEALSQRRHDEDDPPVPDPIFPPFVNGVLARGFTAQYLNKGVSKHGEEALNHPSAHPRGWAYVRKHKLSEGAAWVRMHLLPAPLGGKVTTSNLVPARGVATNFAFRDQVEHPAADALSNGAEDIIWYRWKVSYHTEDETKDFDGFPSHISVQWGGYERKNKQWVPKSARSDRSYRQNPMPPGVGDAEANVNADDAAKISRIVGVSPTFARNLVGLRTDDGDFESLEDLLERLDDAEEDRKGGRRYEKPSFEESKRNLERAAAKGELIGFLDEGLVP